MMVFVNRLETDEMDGGKKKRAFENEKSRNSGWGLSSFGDVTSSSSGCQVINGYLKCQHDWFKKNYHHIGMGFDSRIAEYR